MKIISTLIAFGLLASASAFAEVPTDPTEKMRPELEEKALNLRVEPHWLLFTQVSVDAQFRLGSHFSAGPTLDVITYGSGVFYGPGVATNSVYTDRTTRTMAGLRAVTYFQGVDRHSLYLAGFAKFGKTNVKRNPDSSYTAGESEKKGDFSESVTGLTLGYQWVLRAFTFNAGGGVAYYHHPSSFDFVDSSGARTSYDLGDSEVSFALDAGFGFRF